MSKIKIDKNIPIPDKYSHQKYPFNEMNIGDSFLVDDTNERSLASLVSRAGKRLNMKFILRTVDGYCRCWRVEPKVKKGKK